MNPNAPFTLTVLPSRAESAPGHLHLSAYIDLNRGYADTTNFDAWYNVVQRFHRETSHSSLFHLLCARIENPGVRFRSQAGQETLHKGTVTSRPSDTAVEAWNDAFAPSSNRQPNLLPAATTLEVSGITGAPLVGAERRVLPIAADTTRAAITSMLTAGGMSGARPLTASERAQIHMAAANQAHVNHSRITEALRIAAVRQTVSNPNVSDSLSGLARESVALRRVTGVAFSRSIAYMWRLFDLLNPSPDLRRVFGWTIDFGLQDVTSVGGRTLVDLHLGDQVLEAGKTLADWFDAPPTMLVSLTADPRQTLVAEDDTPLVTNGVLQLNTSTRVVCFDPQSAAESAEQGAQQLAEYPESDRALQEVLGQSPTRWRTPDAYRALAATRGAVAESMAAGSTVRTNLAILKQERYRAALLARVDNRVSNTPTRGLVVYHTQPDQLVAGIGIAQDTPNTATQITAAGAIRGFVIYARRIPRAVRANAGETASPWIPLTTISESLTWRKDGRTVVPAEPFVDREFGINIGGGVRADSASAQGGAGPMTSKVIRDGFISSWDGTGLSSRSPLRHRDRGEGATGADEIREVLLAFERSHDLNDLETIAALMRVRDHLRIEWHPFPSIVSRHSRLTVYRHWATRETKPRVALSFDRNADYQFVAVPQYHNGYYPVDEITINARPELATGATPPAQFLRYDHIRDIVVAFERDIYEDSERKALKRRHAGESERDLVVRTGKLLDNDRSVRVLLPPGLPTFQTYLWYRRADLDAMGPARSRTGDTGPRHSRALTGRQLATWYERYTCDARSAKDFDENKRRAHEKNVLSGAPVAAIRGCGAGCKSFCGGIAQPPVYGGELRYLPDPVVTGLRMEFFADPECAVPHPEYPAQDCFFRNGDYPNLRGWRLVLEKASNGRPGVHCDDRSQTLTVRLGEGHRVRLCATPMYRPEHSHFADSILEGHRLTQAARMVRRGAEVSSVAHLADPLHTNVMTFVLTHATQRPIAKPTLTDALIRRFNPTRPPGPGQEPPSAAMFELDVDISMEWLNTVYRLPDPEVAPTGELELFGIWDDYNDRHDEPSLSLEAKIDDSSPSRGFVRVARLNRADFTALSNRLAEGPLMAPGDVHKVRVTFRSEHAPFTARNHTRMRIRVRNSSQFYSFFHANTKDQMADQDVEQHSRWSDDLPLEATTTPIYTRESVTAPFVANNSKPQQPEVLKIVALVTRDNHRRTRIDYRGNRVRIYLTRKGRQFTGPERIGVLTATAAGGLGVFDGRLSKGGQDIVTDGPALPGVPATDESWLRREHFALGDELEPQYHKLFEPRFEPDVFREAARGVGVVSYRPRFDEDQQLWYLDVELDIPRSDRAELHNPMARLALVTYQPHGANYGSASDVDYRISDVRLTQFFSIYPSRAIGSPRVLFGSGDGNGCILSGALSSLYFKRLSDGTSALRTQFVAEVQRRGDGDIWETIPSMLSHVHTTAGGAVVPRDIQHPPTATASRHLLLPQALSVGRPESLFECEFMLKFDTRFFDFPRAERYRVLLQEIDWFPFVEQDGVGWSALQEKFERHVPLQVPDVRVVQSMLLTAR